LEELVGWDLLDLVTELEQRSGECRDEHFCTSSSGVSICTVNRVNSVLSTYKKLKERPLVPVKQVLLYQLLRRQYFYSKSSKLCIEYLKETQEASTCTSKASTFVPVN
jgi:hypothetical protein